MTCEDMLLRFDTHQMQDKPWKYGGLYTFRLLPQLGFTAAIVPLFPASKLRGKWDFTEQNHKEDSGNLLGTLIRSTYLEQFFVASRRKGLVSVERSCCWCGVQTKLFGLVDLGRENLPGWTVNALLRYYIYFFNVA
jgi:hypothetical protein